MRISCELSWAKLNRSSTLALWLPWLWKLTAVFHSLRNTFWNWVLPLASHPLLWATETLNPVEAGGLFSTFPINFREDQFSKEYLLPSCNGRSVIDSRGSSRPMTSFLSWITVLHDPSGPWAESSRHSQTHTALCGRCWSDSRVARSSDLSTSCAQSNHPMRKNLRMVDARYVIWSVNLVTTECTIVGRGSTSDDWVYDKIRPTKRRLSERQCNTRAVAHLTPLFRTNVFAVSLIIVFAAHWKFLCEFENCMWACQFWGGVYNFLFSALRHVLSNDPLARHNRIVPWQTLELRDDVYAEEYFGAACSFSSGVDLEAGSCVTAKIYI